jgi:nicotinate-nucleotide adenylyltransferase
MQRIGIMGGTFNPIHIGHLIAAQEVLNKMKMDKVIFIPTGNPPHKSKREVIAAADRYDMVKLAIKNNDGFEVSDMEIKRAGHTYTYDTLLELHNIYYETQFYFIIGFDTLKEMDSWKKVNEVCSMTKFIVVNRGNTSKELKEEISIKETTYECKLSLVDIPDIKISSTGIRDRIKNNETIKYLVPSEVEGYINQKGLYKVESHKSL